MVVVTVCSDSSHSPVCRSLYSLADIRAVPELSAASPAPMRDGRFPSGGKSSNEGRSSTSGRYHRTPPYPARSLPGLIAGSVIRVELVPGPRVFDLLVAALLLPLGSWLAASRPARDHARPARQIPAPLLIGLATVTGCVGGIYGIGGGAILAPIL